MSIALHIGAHKTASSHLQNVLYRNREMLAEEKVRVYGPGYLRIKGRNLAAMFATSWSESPPPRRNAHEQLKFLAKGRERLVFTEENFVGNLADSKGTCALPIYPSGADRVAELVAKWAPVKTHLFLAVRDPATFMASTYSQVLFGGAYIRPEEFCVRNDWRLVNWADYVARLRAVPGLKKIFVWRQEDYELSQRLIFRRLLRWKVGAKIKTNEGRVHQGLSLAAVSDTLERAKQGADGPLARAAREAFPVGDTHKPFQLYGRETLKKASYIYAEQMAQIEQMKGVTVLHPPASVLEG